MSSSYTLYVEADILLGNKKILVLNFSSLLSYVNQASNLTTSTLLFVFSGPLKKWGDLHQFIEPYFSKVKRWTNNDLGNDSKLCVGWSCNYGVPDFESSKRYDICDGTYFFPGGNPFLGPQGPDSMKHILCRYVNYQDVNNEQNKVKQ